MPRYALGIEYQGSQYLGWQLQKHGPSVQACVEEALSKLTNELVRVFCAGRTDKGVHATGQVVHFDSKAIRSERALILGTNTHLPKDIRIKWACVVSDDFHARFSATARRYIYLIKQDFVPPAIFSGGVSYYRKPLDIERMQIGAQHLVGTHDFTAFRASQCQAKTPIRSISHLKLHRQGELMVLDIKANAFLHHMVRNIAGVLLTIGDGTYEANWAKTVLEGQNRAKASITAPPGGLYLCQVDYPDVFNLPKSMDGLWFMS